MRGIVIAGTHSGCGKTTVTLGILSALRKKGLTVQPFKTGPDFIDAGLHGIAADRRSRNLDQWMCGQEYVKASFLKHAAGADISVIEGVMGMYDGEFSTANLARLLDVPVILVVDAYGMAESAGAVVRGFLDFGLRIADCRLNASKSKILNRKSPMHLAGVVFNRVASEGHYKRLQESVDDVPVLGYLPRELDFEIPHRHLGLTTAEENPLALKNLDRLSDAVLKHVNVDMIVRNAGILIGEKLRRESVNDTKQAGKFKLAVASDKAFSFYYEDNLDLLRNAGAELIRFSPLVDATVPENADAIYIGGGYPELYAEALSRNTPMLGSIRSWADAGKPIYAECGGLMYLSKGIHDFDGKVFAMAGVFPFETRMMKKPQLGYREITLNKNCILGNAGEKLRGHEFHYSEIVEDIRQGSGVRDQVSGIQKQDSIYSVQDNQSRSIQKAEGFRYKNTLASYIHAHFGSNTMVADVFGAYVQGELRS